MQPVTKRRPLPMDPLTNKITKVSIPRDSLDAIPTSFATVSVGTPSDPLDEKLSAISSAGFQAIELGFPDLVSFARTYHKKEIREDDYDNLCKAGEEVAKLCQKKYKLRIMMLQPFSNFEGWRNGTPERDNAFERARGWIRIMQTVGTEMLQVGSSDSEGISRTREDIVSDLRELADLLAVHQFRLAYENWCWSTHAPTWYEVWGLVQEVDRPNIGLCLDTFQTAAGEYGDPTTSHGLIPDKGFQHKLEMDFKSTLLALTRSVPPEKIYVLQVSDAYKLAAPLPDEVVDGAAPRARWSHQYRPYPFNGGYLPVVQVAKAVLGTGFRGWFSTEVFDGGPKGGKFVKPEGFEGFTKGAMESHKRLMDACADS